MTTESRLKWMVMRISTLAPKCWMVHFFVCGSGRNIVELADENDTHIFNSHGYFCAFINCR